MQGLRNLLIIPNAKYLRPTTIISYTAKPPSVVPEVLCIYYSSLHFSNTMKWQYTLLPIFLGKRQEVLVKKLRTIFITLQLKFDEIRLMQFILKIQNFHISQLEEFVNSIAVFFPATVFYFDLSSDIIRENMKPRPSAGLNYFWVRFKNVGWYLAHSAHVCNLRGLYILCMLNVLNVWKRGTNYTFLFSGCFYF